MKLVGVMLASALAVLAAGCVAASRTCVENAQTGPVEHAENTGEAYLTGVSVTRAGCADRVTFTFVRRLPGYRIEYRPTAEAQTEDASGRHIPVAGEAFLVVRLSGTRTARLTTGGSLVRTYAGPRRVVARDARRAREIVKTGDFEAVVTWAIGLDGKRPFAVSSSGRSLVVDVA